MAALFDAWWRARSAFVHRITHGSHYGVALAVLIAAATSIAGLVALSKSTRVHGALAWCSDHPLLTASIAGSYGLLLVVRRRASLQIEYALSWLRSTPIPARAYSQMIALRISAALATQLTIASVIVVVVALTTDVDFEAVLASIWGGVLLGAIIGALWPAATQHESRPASRVLRRAFSKHRKPSLDGLSHWPIRSALAWHRPENSRFLFIVAALSVPAGSSAIFGFAILATWSLASYLFALARSLHTVGREAALWLQPTTITFGRFAWFLFHRALIHQLAGVILLSLIAMRSGATAVDAVYFAAFWLMLFTTFGLLSLRQHFVGAPSIARVIGAALLVIVAESRLRGCGAITAVAIIFLEWRGLKRVRA